MTKQQTADYELQRELLRTISQALRAGELSSGKPHNIDVYHLPGCYRPQGGPCCCGSAVEIVIAPARSHRVKHKSMFTNTAQELGSEF